MVQQVAKGGCTAPLTAEGLGVGGGGRGQDSRFCAEQCLGCLVKETGKPKEFIILSQRKINLFFLQNKSKLNNMKGSLMYAPLATVMRDNNWQVAVT